MQPMNTPTISSATKHWQPFASEWEAFATRHPVLGLRPTYHGSVNFLRRHRDALLAADVLRRANRRHWIVDTARFDSFAFDLLTQGPL